MGYANGNIQIINGQEYQMYTPAWYKAMQDEAQRSSTAAGTAAGSQLAAASKAAGVPIGDSSSSSSNAASSSSGSGESYSAPPTVPPPSLQGLTAATGGGVMAPTGTQGGATHAHLAPVDTSAADTASFNRAKDQVGLESTGALAGLRSALGGRNLLGGGLEARSTTQAATSAAGQLADVSRQQAITRSDEAQKNAATNYSGDITQRGQDLSKETADNSLAGDLAIAGANNAITQRGQDISDRNARKALEIEQAQMASTQRSTALAGLEAALKVTAPASGMY